MVILRMTNSPTFVSPKIKHYIGNASISKLYLLSYTTLNVALLLDGTLPRQSLGIEDDLPPLPSFRMADVGLFGCCYKSLKRCLKGRVNTSEVGERLSPFLSDISVFPINGFWLLLVYFKSFPISSIHGPGITPCW